MNRITKIMASMAVALGLSACSSEPALTLSGLDPQDFVGEKGGKATALYTLTNANGMEVCITNFGGRLVSVMVPDRDGKMTDVILGFDNIQDYMTLPSDFGASIGRYANRIAGGTFELDGQTVVLNQNDGPNCLHGGAEGWQYQVYDVVEATDNAISLKRISPDGDNKFPGNVEAVVKFELTDDNAIEITYDATTDAPTIINMTNHTYFNLSGDFNNTIEESILQVNADFYTPADETYMPTGEVRPVEGTVFDFRTPKAIGADFASGDAEIAAAGGGYDHNWCLNTKGNQDEVCATMVDPRSGIKLEMYTNEPGVQCYTANFQDGTRPGKGGIMYQKYCAICLESQKYPDSPNKYNMPGWEDSNAFVTPENPYHSYCKYVFSVEE